MNLLYKLVNEIKHNKSFIFIYQSLVSFQIILKFIFHPANLLILQRDIIIFCNILLKLLFCIAVISLNKNICLSYFKLSFLYDFQQLFYLLIDLL